MAKIQIKNSFITSSAQITISSSLVRFSDNIRAKSITGSFNASGTGTNIFVQSGNSFGTTALLGTNDNQPLAFETNGSERMRITNTGCVGIGTTSVRSNSILDVYGAGVFGTSTYGFYVGTDATGAFLDAGTQLIRMFAGQTERIRIQSDGNVGIGTTASTGELHIYGSQPAFRIQSSVSGNMQFGQWDTTYNRIQSSGRDFLLISTDATNLIFSTNTSERMRITSGGNVGIGTTVSAEKLSVEGSVILAASDGTSLGSGRKIRFYRASDGWEPAQIEQIWTGGGYQGVLAFKTNTGALGTLTTKMVINNDGNVGIGTTSPSVKLHVSGSAIVGDVTYAGSIGNYIRMPFGSGNLATGTLRGYIQFDSSIDYSVNGGDAWKWKLAAVARPGSGGNYNSQLEILRTTRTGVTDNTDFAINRDGNIGINTINPATKLDVRGNLFVANASTGNNIIAFGNIGTLGPLNGAPNNLTGSAFLVVSSSVASGAPSHMKFYTTSGGTCGERVRISADGNLGIGNTSPSYKLDVAGSVYAYNYWTLTSASTFGATDYSSCLQFFGSTGSGGLTNTIKFITNGSEKMRITANGSVGIGTTAPTYPLVIAGQTQIRSGHGETRLQLYYPNATLAYEGYLTAWASEPGISYNCSGIGGNVNIGGQYYGRQTNSSSYAMYIRFDVNYGYTEFYASTGAAGAINGQGSRVMYVDSTGVLSTSGLRTYGASSLANNTTIDPDNYQNYVIAGGIADGSGWSVSTAIGGNSGVGDSWAIGHNGSALFMAMGNGSANDSLQTYIQFDANRNLYLVPTSGCVGIGTSSPSNKTTIQADATGASFADNGVGQLVIRGATNTAKRLGLGIDTTNNIGVIQAQLYGTGQYPLVLNPAGGSVGIGTSTVAGQFHIGGTATNSNPWMVLDINDTYFKRIVFSEERPTYGVTGYGGYIGYDASGNLVTIGTYENGTDNRAISIKRENGSVGIGTTSPNANLHVSGTFQVGIGTNFGNKFTLYESFASGKIGFCMRDTNGDDIYSVYCNSTTGEVRLIADDDNGVAFMTFQMNASERMRITNAGNVGIGTSNPIYKLDNYYDTIRYTLRTAEKTLAVGFPNGVANQKVDIIFDVAPGNVVFWGNLQVEITDGFNYQLTTGKLVKVFAVGLNPATGAGPYSSAIFDNTSYYTDAYGAVADNWAIDGIFFNSTTGKYYITIVHRTSTGNTPIIKITGFGYAASSSDNINNLTAGAVYTTNTTVYYKPVVETLQSRIGYNGNINQSADLIVQGGVGIGTTSPGVKFEVYQTSNDAVIRSKTTTAGAYVYLDSGTDGYFGLNLVNAGTSKWFVGSYGTTSFTITKGIADTEYFRIDTNGNVGIGTTAVSANLVVGYNGAVHYAEAGGANVLIKGKTGNSRGLLEIHDSAGTVRSYFQSVYSTGLSYLGTISNHSLVLTTNGTEKARLDTNGNLGIGTTSADKKLQVIGSIGTGVNLYQVAIDNLAASTTQAKRFEILRSFIDYNDWNSTGAIEIEVRERYYSDGRYKKYVLSYGYNSNNTGSLWLVEDTGRGANDFQATIGSAVQISGDIYYVPVYIEIDYYQIVDVLVRTNKTRTTNASSPSSGVIYINESPTGTNIASFGPSEVTYISLASQTTYLGYSGNVGIGTSSPTAKLHINGTTNFAANVYHSVGGQKFFAGSGGAYGYIYTGTTALNFINGGDTSTLMTILNGGNVGIGTTTVSRKLVVYGDAAFATNSGGLIIASYDADTVNLRPSVANGTTLISDDSGLPTRGTEFLNGGGILVQSLSGYTPLEVKSNGSSLLYVASGGSIGIGTTSPSSSLDVRGVIQGQSYGIPNTGASSQWVKIGTLKIPQQGYTAHIRAYIHEGYNALNSQDFYVDIFFKTSNGSSVDSNGFAGNSWYYTNGFNLTNVTPKWVGNAAGVSATSYDLYLNLPSFTNQSHYIVEIVTGVTWKDVGATGQVNPGNGSSTVCVSTLGFNIPIGNVGIGTTTPSYKFQVNGGQFGTSLKGGDLGAGSEVVRMIKSDDTYAMVVRGDGYVGIGTSTVNYPIDLQSTTSPLTLNLKLNKSSTTNDYAELAFQLWSGAGSGANTFGGSGTSRPSVVLRALNENGSSAAGAFVVGTFEGGSTNVTLTEKFRIASTGNVGIGSTSPAAKLDVVGSVKATSFTGSFSGSIVKSLGYLYAGRSTSQTIPAGGSTWANVNITMSKVYASGSIGYNSTNGVVSLKARAVYRITAALSINNSTNNIGLNWSLFKHSNNAQIAQSIATDFPTYAFYTANMPMLDMIYAPTSSVDVKLRCTAANTQTNVLQIYSENTYLIVQQLA